MGKIAENEWEVKGEIVYRIAYVVWIPAPSTLLRTGSAGMTVLIDSSAALGMTIRRSWLPSSLFDFAGDYVETNYGGQR